MDKLAGILFYGGVFILSATLIYLGEKHQRRMMRIFGVLLPVVVAAVRFNTGIDYENYIRIITKEIDWMTPAQFFASSASEIYEPTLYYFMKFAEIFSWKEVVFFGIYALLTIVPFYLAMRKISAKWSWLAILAYLLMFFAPSLNGMRQFAAASVAFWGIVQYIYDTRPIWAKTAIFVGVVWAAALIHSSTIIMMLLLPAYWVICWIRKQNVTYMRACLIILTLVAVAAEFILLPNIGAIPFLERFAGYVGSMGASENLVYPNVVPKLAVMLVGFVLLPQLMKDDKNNLFFLAMCCMALVTDIPGFFIPYGYRLSFSFQIFQVPLLVAAVRSAPADRRRMYFWILIAYATVFFLYSTIYNNSHGVIPYQFITY